MNLPNKLTLLRVFLIPFFLIFLMCNFTSFDKWIAIGIFTIASLTDMLDGMIARKYNLITNFGKFMDPLADKLLVCSAMIALATMQRIPAWVVIIIIAREFIISGFRLIASDNNIVIAASMWGKVKTVVQMLMILLLICDFGSDVVQYIEYGFIYTALALTVVSLVDYLIKNRCVLKEQH